MTETVSTDDEQASPAKRGLSSLQKSLFGVLAFFFVVHVVVFIALIPRFIWELPWLLFFDQIKAGVEHGALWTYMWSPILLGGDAR